VHGVIKSSCKQNNSDLSLTEINEDKFCMSLWNADHKLHFFNIKWIEMPHKGSMKTNWVHVKCLNLWNTTLLASAAIHVAPHSLQFHLRDPQKAFNISIKEDDTHAELFSITGLLAELSLGSVL